MGGTVGGSFSVQSEPDCSLRTSMDNAAVSACIWGEEVRRRQRNVFIFIHDDNQ